MSGSPAARLLAWFERGHRDLPWRRTRDPYRIWLSEIMLQQTRAAAVIPYYEMFLERFPSPSALAAASESEVLAAWSGLGYYSRARNLRRAAARVVELGGFPKEYDAIRELPGVGPYTAAAVASIAFGLPHAVLDGNVLRVIARVTNDASDIGSTATRVRYQQIADQWLERERPGAFNQAMMELGATVCLPREPLCLVCPIVEFCRAHAEGRARELPVKLRKGVPEKIETQVLIAERGDSVLLRQRGETERRMAGFWELPAPAEAPGLRNAKVAGCFQHTIVNQCFSVSVYCVTWPGGRAPRGWKWWKREDLGSVPITTVTRKALALRKG